MFNFCTGTVNTIVLLTEFVLCLMCRVREGNLDNVRLFCFISQEPMEQITQNIFVIM